MMDTLRHDLSYGFRQFVRRPGLTAMLVLTVAVGVGAATAAFGVVKAVLLRPLPVADQQRVVILTAEDRKRPEARIGVPSSGVTALRKTGRAFGGIAAVRVQGAQPFAVRYHDRLLSLTAAFVGGDYFRVLGVVPAAGRLFGPEDDAAGARPSVVLSYPTWRRDFGGDTAVVGQTIELINGPQLIVGVAPSGFEYPAGTDVWAAMSPIERMFPMAAGPNAGFPSDIVARLQPGVTLGEARAEFTRYVKEYPSRLLGEPSSRNGRADLFADRVVGNLRPALLVLSAAAILVLVIALINAAGLLLTRGLSRGRELAIRAALGAGRERLVRQLLTESIVIAVAAALLGVAAAGALLRTAARLAPPELVRFHEIHLDVGVLVFALAVTCVSVLIFGFAPAIRIARQDLDSALRGGSKTIAGSRHGDHTRSVIVAGQVALATVVLIGAGLLQRSLGRLQHVDLGFRPEALLVIGLEDMTPFNAHTDDWKLGAERYHSVLDALAARLPHDPTIAGMTTAFVRPFAGSGMDLPYEVDGGVRDGAPGPRTAAYEAGLESHFAVLGIALRRGRDFTVSDRTGAPAVAIVNEAFAQRAWSGEDPIGRRVRMNPTDSTQPWRTVVGVAEDTRYRDIAIAPQPTVYVPLRQTQAAPMYVVLRTTADDPLRVAATVKSTIREAGRAFGIREVVAGRDLLETKLARPRFIAGVLAVLGAIAIFLAGIGLYALSAASVRERHHEIGVRVALGATPRGVYELIVRRAVVVIGSGLIIGVALGMIGGRLLRALLYEVSPTDPSTLGAVVLTLIAMATAAVYVPAARAARIDPLVALRHE